MPAAPFQRGMHARDARVVDRERGVWRAAQAELAASGVKPHAFAAELQLQKTLMVDREHRTAGHGGVFIAPGLPLDAVNVAGFRPAPQIHGPHAAQRRFLHRQQCFENVFSGEDLRRTGQVGQPRGRVDGVAKTVAVNLDDFTRLYAYLHLHRRACAAGLYGFVEQPLLYVDAGSERIALGLEHHKQPVAQHLDHTPVVLLEHLAQHAHQLAHKARRSLVPQPLVHAGTAYKISKNDSGHGSGSRTGEADVNTLACVTKNCCQYISTPFEKTVATDIQINKVAATPTPCRALSGR